MSDEAEEFSCDECGETWLDSGVLRCPFCDSARIHPIEENS